MSSSELHSRGKELFLAARELAPEERTSYLDDACEGRRELRREVESLLAHHVRSPEGPAGDEEGEGIGDPALVSGYRLLRRVGEGGMGEVFEAEQFEPVHRRAAIKILKRGLETREIVARFESERQALALMDHSNVAYVFEAGSTKDGRPYFAMEFVDGVSITSYCDDRQLPVRDRLELFRQVCLGVQHAHQRGVIHRDLKPSNVLVTDRDGRAVPKVIDFGIAKAAGARLTEKTLVTRAGDWMGTPETMSPEQAAGSLDVDTRTDVYSLGVMLYEILAGALPFDPNRPRPSSSEELRRRIQHEEPVRPSAKVGSLGAEAEQVAQRRGTHARALVGALRGDLDWIILKALEKDRTRRYESPAAMAADLARHLAHKPVEAGPPSAIYRALKFGRRHRLGVAAGLVMGVSVTLGAWGLLQGLLVARDEAEAAERAAGALVGVLEELDPQNVEGFAQSPREVLERAAERIDTELAGQPVLRARLLATLGRIYTVVGNYREAARLLDDAVATQRRWSGPDHLDLAASLSSLGSLRLATGDFEGAERSFEEALAIRRKALAPGAIEIARSVTDVGVASLRRGRFQNASALLEEALGLKAAVLGLDHPEVADVRYFQSHVWVYEGEFEKAREALVATLEGRRRRLPPDHPAIGWCLNALGFMEQNAGNLSEAEAYLRQSLKTLERAFGPGNPAIAMPLGNLAWTLYLRGDLVEARATAERALEIRRRSLGSEHHSISWSLATVGSIERLEGNYASALELHRRQLEVAETALGPDHPTVGWALLNVGLDLIELERFSEARQPLERGRVLFEELSKAGERGVGWMLNALGYLAWQEGELDLALPLLERATSVLEGVLGSSHPNFGNPLMNLGALHRDRGELALARPIIERGYELRLRALGSDHPQHANDLHTLARLNHREGNLEIAGRLYEQSAEATERILGPEHPWVARALIDHAELLRSAGQNRRAAELEARAARLGSRSAS